MKKILIILVLIIFQAALSYGGRTTYGSIKDEVQKKMDMIKNGGKSGHFVKEIKVKKGRVKKKAVVKKKDKSGYIGTLSSLNIVGGIFEGGIIGASCGLIGYSQLKNRDIEPLVNGAIAGTISGASLAVILSIVEASTGRYSMSDDLGFDLFGGLLTGAVIGAGGGAISYAKTDSLEDISEGIGFGAAIGVTTGFIIAIVEMVLPEDIRGGNSYGEKRAMNIKAYAGGVVLSYNFEY